VRAIRRRAATTAPGLPIRAGDGHGRLSHGVLVEASVLARLLGLRLLTVEVTALLAPAELRAGPAVRDERAGAPKPVAPVRRTAGARHGLAGAVRDLDESARLLAQARRPDRAHRTRTGWEPPAR
jgi:hypothetical protein